MSAAIASRALVQQRPAEVGDAINTPARRRIAKVKVFSRYSSDGHACGWWLVAGGWWLVAGGWWLVAGGWWL
ncbi:MAG TPA: hypothetical protein VF306_06675, partial [Pirellulales bacterium]